MQFLCINQATSLSSFTELDLKQKGLRKAHVSRPSSRGLCLKRDFFLICLIPADHELKLVLIVLTLSRNHVTLTLKLKLKTQLERYGRPLVQRSVMGMYLRISSDSLLHAHTHARAHARTHACLH